MTTIGTNHFLSFRDACLFYEAYYANYDEACLAVREKIANEEIKIGKPRTIGGQYLTARDRRWFITNF